jgi:hypothetical protein
MKPLIIKLYKYIIILIMTLLTIITLVTLFAAFYLNLYKYSIMIDCWEFAKEYKIFPWSTKPQLSKSHPLWLILHLTVSFALLVLVSLRLIYPDLFDNPTNDAIFSIFHYAFTILILVNFTNFGNKTPFIASIINLTPLALMNILYFNNWEFSYHIYFAILASPIFIEGYKYWVR